MKPTLPRLVFLTLIALLVTATSSAQAQTPTPLPPLSGDAESEAIWINDRNQVVGNSINNDVRTAVVWDEHSTPRRLRPLIGDDSASVSVLGNSINNKGEVVGNSGGRPVRWDRNGTPRALPMSANFARAISDSGLVLGQVGESQMQQVVVWDKKDRPTVRSTNDIAGPTSINTRGDAIGFQSAAGTRVAFLWPRNGTTKTLGGAQVYSINDKGQVAGFFHSIIVGPTAIVWDSKKGTTTLLPPLPGDDNAEARGINQFREVVGISLPPLAGGRRAVVWDQDDNPTALPPLAGGAVSEARGINKAGVVVGISIDSSGTHTAVKWEWCGGDGRRCR